MISARNVGASWLTGRTPGKGVFDPMGDTAGGTCSEKPVADDCALDPGVSVAPHPPQNIASAGLLAPHLAHIMRFSVPFVTCIRVNFKQRVSAHFDQLPVWEVDLPLRRHETEYKYENACIIHVFAGECKREKEIAGSCPSLPSPRWLRQQRRCSLCTPALASAVLARDAGQHEKYIALRR